MKLQFALALLIFSAVTLFSPISFANQLQNGECTFLVYTRKGYAEMGEGFMTAKLNLMYRGLDLNSRRFIIATNHQNYFQDDVMDKIIEQQKLGQEIETPRMINDLKANCGGIEFKINRVNASRKPRYNFEEDINKTTLRECERDPDTVSMNEVERPLIWKGCDLAIYEVDYSTTTPKDLDKIRGFHPTTTRDRKNELDGTWVYLGENPQKPLTGIPQFKCQVRESLANVLFLNCPDLSKLTNTDDLSKLGIYSGSVILPADPSNPDQIITFSKGIPAALGVLTYYELSDRGEFKIVIDTVDGYFDQ